MKVCYPNSVNSTSNVNAVVPKVSENEMNRAVQVAKYLVDYGKLSKIQASAAAGVFLMESHCDPREYNHKEKDENGSKYTRNGGYGAGIQQWSGLLYKKQALKQANFNEDDLIENHSLCDQAKMVVGNINGNDKAHYNILKTKTKLEDAVVIMDMKTMRPGDKSWKKSGGPTLEDELRVVGIYVKGAGAYNNNRFSKVLGYAQQVLRNLDKYDGEPCDNS